MEDSKELNSTPVDSSTHKPPEGSLSVNAEHTPEVTPCVSPKQLVSSKPEFAPFIQELRDLISNPNLNSVSNVVRFIRKGYKGAKLPQRIQEIFDTLVDWSSFTQLAIDLCLPSGPLHRIELLRLLRPHLATYSQHKTEYPEPTSETSRSTQLVEWVAEKLKNSAPDIDTHERSALHRLMFVCLAGEFVSDSVPALYHLLQQAADHNVDYGTQESARESLAELAIYLHQPGKQQAKFKGVMRFVGAALHAEQLRADATTSAQRKCRHFENEITVLEQQLNDAQSQCLELADRYREMETQCANLTIQLANQVRERQLDEDHSQQLAHQQLVKTVDDLIRRVMHDLSEAQICLEQDPPNVSMALDRLARTITWISKRRPSQ